MNTGKGTEMNEITAWNWAIKWNLNLPDYLKRIIFL